MKELIRSISFSSFFSVFKFRSAENIAKMGRNLERRTGGIVANVNVTL
jgi:hypothetical protein